MRYLATLLCLAALVACGDGSTSPGGDDSELPRGAFQLLVERYSRAGERSYYTMAVDGSLVAPFGGVPEDARLLVPSPDGRTIAYLRTTPDDLVHLWLMDRDGQNQRALRDGEWVVNHVTWSPDRLRLAFEASTLTDFEDIWVIRTDGTGLQNLTPDPKPAVVSDRAPSWSPDGTRIAFTSNRSGGTRLWIMNADGGSPRQVIPSTSVPAAEATPVWSLDGVWIAFLSPSTGGGLSIGLVRPDGSGYHTYPVAGDAGRLAFAPDGRVLYSTNYDGDYELYVLDPESGVSQRLTRHADHDFRATLMRWVEPGAWQGFAAPARYPLTAAQPPAIAAGDVNADGELDVAVLAPSTSLVRLLRGTGGGALQSIGGLNAADDHREVIVTDVSRDGVADIAVSGGRELSVWRGSTGGPGLATTYPLDGEVRGLISADFDRDGSADVAVIHEAAGSGFRMMVYTARLTDGELIATVDVPTTVTGAVRACAGDVTGEGAMDVVVLTSNPTAPVVLLPGQGDISFAPLNVATTAVTVDADAIPVCADLDGDRRADLALLRPNQSPGLTILRSLGTTFASPVTVSVSGSAVAPADIDRDGDVDLLVLDPMQGTVNVLRNRGDGRLSKLMGVGIGGAPLRLITADLDGDTWADVVTAATDGTVSVLLNRGRM